MVKTLRDIDQTVWDQYASSHPASTPYHLYGWQQIIESSYGHAPYYLIEPRTLRVDSPAVSGILPLVFFNCPTGEKRLISLPFFDGAGLVADTPEIERKLLSSALKLMVDLGAAHLEIRQDYPAAIFAEVGQEAIDSGLIYKAHDFKVGLRRGLPELAESLWRLFPSKLRNQIRKARQYNYQVRVGGLELVDDFYAVFSQNMRDLGSPVHAKIFFREIFNHFPEQASIILVAQKSMPLAAALVFQFQETLYNPWASSLRAFRPHCPNMLLYWEMLSFACQQELRFFDFGRSSPQATTCAFKLQWGAEMRPLVWHIFSRFHPIWEPQRESLVIEYFKELDLAQSQKLGPELRRWISL